MKDEIITLNNWMEWPIRTKIIDRLPLIYVALSGFGFSIQSLAVKILALNGYNSSFVIVFYRGLIQSILCLAIIHFSRTPNEENSVPLFGNSNRIRFILFLRGVLGFVGIASAFTAYTLIPLGDATVLVMLSPLVAAIMCFLVLGEPYRLPELCATILSLVGVVLVAKPPFLFGGASEQLESMHQFYLGILFGVLASLGAGGAYTCIRVLGTSDSMPWPHVCFSQSFAQVLLSPFCMFFVRQSLFTPISLFQLALILSSGSLGAVCQIGLTIGLQREKGATASAMRMTDVVFAFLWQVLFTSEELSWLSVLGAFLVSSSVLVVVWFKQSNSDGKRVNTDISSSDTGGPGTIEMPKYSSVGMEDVDMDDEGIINDTTSIDNFENKIKEMNNYK